VRVLGVDLGSRYVGWALLDGSGRVSSGTWELGRHAGLPRRLLRLYRALRQHRDLTVVAYERVYHHRGTRAAQVYGATLGVLLLWAELGGVPVVDCTVQSVKRVATGDARADKASVVEAARARWSLAACGEDEADALFVALGAQQRLSSGGA
jgi:Holliday junction resolvasome RuvABC endonuclease subunit